MLPLLACFVAACAGNERAPGKGGSGGASGGTGNSGGAAGNTGNAGASGAIGGGGVGGSAGAAAGGTTGAGTAAAGGGAGAIGGGGAAGAAGNGGGAGGTGAAGANGGRGGSSTGAAGIGGGRGGSAGGNAAGAAGTVGSGGSAGSGTSGSNSVNACTGTASGTPANTLTVNADSAQSVVSDGIFGLLMERLGKNWSGGLFVGTSSSIPNTDGMRKDVIQAFKDAGIGMIEWPGGCAANGYDWSANKNPSNDVGTDRYMELCGLLGIPPIVAGQANDTTTDPANNLAWVTYINNNPSHPDWTINYFKLGNEVWGCGAPGGSNGTEAQYETFYNAGYAMLSTPVNGKKLNLVASTGLIGNWTWFDAEVKNLVGKIDGVEVHDYIYHPSDIPNVGFTDAQYYSVVNAANKGQIGPRIDRIIQTLDQYDPGKHIKIYEDEWGDWLEPFNKATDGWLQQGTLMDAISAAESLHLFMQHADRYAMAGLAQGINVIHSLLLTRSTDSALVKTPTFYVFKMLLPHHRANAKWAPNTLTSENITGNGLTFPVLSAGTTVDDTGAINISLANVDLVNTRTIRITVNSSKSAYVVSTAQVITGPAKDSYNDYAQTENVNIQTLAGSSCAISGKTLQVTLPAKSVVMLVLTPQ